MRQRSMVDFLAIVQSDGLEEEDGGVGFKREDGEKRKKGKGEVRGSKGTGSEFGNHQQQGQKREHARNPSTSRDQDQLQPS